MRQRHHIAALVGAMIALPGCADEPTRPAAARPTDASAVLAVSDHRAAALQVALRDARERSLQAVDRDNTRDKLERALEALSARLDARDRRGVERAIRDARGALSRYRATLGEDSGLLPDLEAISIMLEEFETTAAADVSAQRNSRED